ncbi:olfactory receptor 2B6-like [Pseudophryne corroboree]|uniref:olfactory receptor 2B6-like n=1 Tax=Pseudophryne corroboree TaxID=495146 RepID=UPI00308201D6
MPWKNNTDIMEFILLGLSSEPRTQVILFFIFLLVYMIILIGNISIIILIWSDISLHTPMYFFLGNLSFVDLCYTSCTVPRMLKDLISVKKTISYAECITQMYTTLCLGQSECGLLAIMAYDRYIAICYPLHYTTIMSKAVCVGLTIGIWLCGFIFSTSLATLTLNVNRCDNKEINHFLCQVPEVLSLGCENISFIEFVVFVESVILLLIPVTFIIITYSQIIICILKIKSSAGQRKAFSTCGSHILVVTIFYGSAMAAFMKPRSNSQPSTDKFIAIFYLIFSPMLNPLIYTLRNNDVKAAFSKLKFRMVYVAINLGVVIKK